LTVNLFETIELIQNTAKETVGAELLAVPNDPESHLLVAGGKAEKIATPFVQQPRRHTVESITSFAAAFDRWGVTQEPKANIWIDLDKWLLTFFTDEPLRRSWVDLRLKPSPQLKLLQTFANEKAMEQKALVRMLRHDLADCVEIGVLAAFRSVDFQKLVTARANIQHEKQSLDSDVVALVTGDKKPDSFTVDAPLFSMRELDARTRVGITIDIDCDNRKFVLQAKPGHVEMALDDARAAVLTKLTNELAAAGHEDVVILAGTPGERR
jgi:hypothetical protein